MKLTEEQIKSNLAAYEHAMRTEQHADIEIKIFSVWTKKCGMSFDYVANYRIRPTPRLRPWKPEEVPQYALIRKKGQRERIEVIAVRVAPYRAEAFVTVFTDGYKVIHDHWSYESALQLMEHSTDSGKTWLPCGVMEEGK